MFGDYKNLIQSPENLTPTYSHYKSNPAKVGQYVILAGGGTSSTVKNNQLDVYDKDLRHYHS